MATVRYTVIDGQIIAEKRGGVRKFYSHDAEGNTVALYDNTQTKTDTFTYWPYGELRTSTGTTPTKYKFLGAWSCRTQIDGSVKTNEAREVVPNDGRFRTVDPMWPVLPDEHPFIYGGDNPTSLFDPSGRKPRDPKPKVFSEKSMFDCKEGQRCIAALAKYSGGGHFGGGYTRCLHNTPSWKDDLIDCACNAGVSPVLLMALMWIESHYGTAGGDERCANPVSVHFCEKGSIKSLRHKDGTLPTLKESLCAAAKLIARDHGLRQGTWGQAGDVQRQYDLFKRLCKERGLL